ncbi:uncharacterized protein LOC121941561 [Plectropomus leopardus]|uniref:uncharacterized protein LOC121941561 n=1 Tax=Plectropomus leopardus TaxID=160734 RepID=UPI001C4D4376|nr:uncharacterized protein LOC121941561 [Plectropomus leopardus]
MQRLCIAALLLSAVAAQLDVDSKLGDDEEWVSEVPEGGNVGSGVDGSDWAGGQPWLLETPPWLPQQRFRRQGMTGPQRPVERPRGRPRGAPERHKGPGGREPNGRKPLVPSPVFKVENVEFQNTTAVPLKEGENVFRMLRNGGKGGPQLLRGGRNRPKREFPQYVKLIYSAAEPNKVSIEFGVMKPENLGELVGEEENLEEEYW